MEDNFGSKPSRSHALELCKIECQRITLQCVGEISAFVRMDDLSATGYKDYRSGVLAILDRAEKKRQAAERKAGL